MPDKDITRSNSRSVFIGHFLLYKLAIFAGIEILYIV